MDVSYAVTLPRRGRKCEESFRSLTSVPRRLDGEGGITLIKGPPGTGVSTLVHDKTTIYFDPVLIFLPETENDNSYGHSEFAAHCKFACRKPQSNVFYAPHEIKSLYASDNTTNTTMKFVGLLP